MSIHISHVQRFSFEFRFVQIHWKWIKWNSMFTQIRANRTFTIEIAQYQESAHRVKLNERQCIQMEVNVHNELWKTAEIKVICVWAITTSQSTIIIVLDSKVFTTNVQYSSMFIVSSHRISKLIAAVLGYGISHYNLREDFGAINFWISH